MSELNLIKAQIDSCGCYKRNTVNNHEDACKQVSDTRNTSIASGSPGKNQMTSLNIQFTI